MKLILKQCSYIMIWILGNEQKRQDGQSEIRISQGIADSADSIIAVNGGETSVLNQKSKLFNLYFL